MTVQLQTPYELVGGMPVVQRIVDRFYDLMESDPDYAALRAMHAPDLAPMRASLSGFLTAWLGGPRDWFQERPGVCMMSAHRNISITAETAQQWALAMRRAIADAGMEPTIAAKMAEALSSLAIGMGRG